MIGSRRHYRQQCRLAAGLDDCRRREICKLVTDANARTLLGWPTFSATVYCVIASFCKVRETQPTFVLVGLIVRFKLLKLTALKTGSLKDDLN